VPQSSRQIIGKMLEKAAAMKRRFDKESTESHQKRMRAEKHTLCADQLATRTRGGFGGLSPPNKTSSLPKLK